MLQNAGYNSPHPTPRCNTQALLIAVTLLQLLFETIIDHMANFTVSTQTFEMVKVRKLED